jgi:hypothetical protein
MAVEIAAGRYLLGPTHDDDKKQLPFRYGSLHDLESIWWIALWFLFIFEPTESAGLQHPRATGSKNHSQAAGLLFSSEVRYHR